MNVGEKDRNRHKFKASLGILSIVGGIAVGAIGISNYIEGSKGNRLPEKIAQIEALREYDGIYKSSSPIGKFILKYLVEVSVNELVYPHASGKIASQVDGLSGSLNWTTTIGNSCLKQTAYNITVGNVEVNLGQTINNSNSILTDGKAYADINPMHPGILIIHPDKKNVPSLYFRGFDNQKSIGLTPASQATKNILVSYGCLNLIDTVKTSLKR